VSALQLGVAAGAANVTRRGLATAQRDLIEKLVGQVRICRLKIQARLTDEGAGHQ
jgi:fructose-1-phosphate kinase PfkB-like protein